MILPNGYGSITKLSGNSSAPFAAGLMDWHFNIWTDMYLSVKNLKAI